jgi:hypothetical protein
VTLFTRRRRRALSRNHLEGCSGDVVHERRSPSTAAVFASAVVVGGAGRSDGLVGLHGLEARREDPDRLLLRLGVVDLVERERLGLHLDGRQEPRARLNFDP